jgi:hypothetical protein
MLEHCASSNFVSKGHMSKKKKLQHCVVCIRACCASSKSKILVRQIVQVSNMMDAVQV